MRILQPKVAARRWNGDKPDDVRVMLPDAEWKQVKERIETLGFGGLDDYVASLIEMDLRVRLPEKVLAFEMKSGGLKKAPTSRIADRTGLSPDLVVHILSQEGRGRQPR